MNDTADDLLLELESLDETDTASSSAAAPQPGVQPHTSPMETLLEATRLAQEAGEQAQIAAERSLTLAKEEKERIIEISEALGAWRHASRSAIEDVRAARRHMAIMMGVSLLFGAAAMGVTGWMMYQIKYEAESAKADILDLMQTQFTLFNQKTGLKVDELASLIESMQAEIQRMLKESALGVQNHVTPVTIVGGATSAGYTPHGEAGAHDVPHHKPPAIQHTAAHSPAAPHSASPHGAEHTPASKPAGAHHAPHPMAEHAPTSTRHGADTEDHDTPQAATYSVHAPEPHTQANPVDTHLILARLDALEKQLTTLLRQQQHSTVHTVQPSAIPSAGLAELRKMLLEQAKQLHIIRSALWKLRKQQTQASAPEQGNDLTTLKQAIDTLTEQVNQLREQQNAMQKALEKLKQEATKMNQPYHYKAPPLHLE